MPTSNATSSTIAWYDKYNFFIWEVVSAHVAVSPRHPETLHYKGEGTFMVAGKIVHRRKLAQM